MDENQLDDLKQFITATVSQTETRLVGRLENLEQKVDDGFAGIGEAIEQINEQHAGTERRLTKLEQQVA